jgi:hypothetical protein
MFLASAIDNPQGESEEGAYGKQQKIQVEVCA